MKTRLFRPAITIAAITLTLAACNQIPNDAPGTGTFPSAMPTGMPTMMPSTPPINPTAMPTMMPSDMPTTMPSTMPTAMPAMGDIANGENVFRYETFGNEHFWTDAARLPEGLVTAGITPVQALQLGLHVDVEALSPEIVEVVAAELQTDLSPENAPALNDPNTTVALINANAVIGVVPIDTNNDGTLDVLSGDKVGVSCVLCHGETDKSVFDLPNAGSIGKRVDGPGATNLNVGAILATAANTRAFYPFAQLQNPGNVGRAPAEMSLTPTSTEAEFDAYFGNPDYYPVGTFDVTFDGVGNPAPNPGLFGETLEAPFGGPANIQALANFNNLVYTGLMDPTGIANPLARPLAGNKLVDDYIQVLADTGVTGYPFVEARNTNESTENSLIGLRVDDQKLMDMDAYLKTLRNPS